MEADLDRYYQRDYRDRWRTDSEGRPKLTLRQIWVRVRHLPPDSAVARTHPDWSPWRLEHHQLDDLRMSVLATIPTKDRGNKIKPHPSRPGAGGVVARRTRDPDRVRRMNAAMKRRAERQRLIDSGEIPMI